MRIIRHFSRYMYFLFFFMFSALLHIFSLFLSPVCPRFVPQTINEGQKTVPRQRENLITNKAGNSHGKENYRTKGTGQAP